MLICDQSHRDAYGHRPIKIKPAISLQAAEKSARLERKVLHMQKVYNRTIVIMRSAQLQGSKCIGKVIKLSIKGTILLKLIHFLLLFISIVLYPDGELPTYILYREIIVRKELEMG